MTFKFDKYFCQFYLDLSKHLVHVYHKIDEVVHSAIFTFDAMNHVWFLNNLRY